MTAATIPPVVPVVPILVSAYDCRCQRMKKGKPCGHTWRSECKCPPNPGFGEGAIHLQTCRPPVACPRCKQVGWDKPAAWTNRRAPKVARRKH